MPFTNLLITEKSRYLKQHAHNPVEWHTWSEQVLDLAREQNKPLLISIGYSACHWCHVMAHESFEDPPTAEIMNEHFICVKVDREERPDIDTIYMQAVQMMTGSGGWPLNVFALPDGRPFYGGTYFSRSQWQNICRAVSHEYQNNRGKLAAYADDLESGLQNQLPLKASFKANEFDSALIHQSVDDLSRNFDRKNGGLLGAPKFPLPSLLNYILDFSILSQDKDLENFLTMTLENIARGGIYDHIGGGFSRYSVDSRWKVPHFEKMLYDNAQLLSVYSRAFRLANSSLFKDRIQETADFLLREFQSEEGLFASSLDADSEGVEGKYYIWNEHELKEDLADLYPIAKSIFSIDAYGQWENGAYILQQKQPLQQTAADLGMPFSEIQDKVSEIKNILFSLRQKRIPPGLDTKYLTAWNGLAIKGLVDSYIALRKPEYLEAAQRASAFILQNVRTKEGALFHVYAEGTAYNSGYLDDYAAMISALISLYQADLDENHLLDAKKMMEYTLQHFEDQETGYFYTTADFDTHFIKRDINLIDGVIPSANSCIAHSLFTLARYFELDDWEQKARRMAANLSDEINNHPASFGNWGSLYLKLSYPYIDISITGQNSCGFLQEMWNTYSPNMLFAGTDAPSELPILQNRYSQDQTLFYVCKDKTCMPPVDNINDVKLLI